MRHLLNSFPGYPKGQISRKFQREILHQNLLVPDHSDFQLFRDMAVLLLTGFGPQLWGKETIFFIPVLGWLAASCIWESYVLYSSLSFLFFILFPVIVNLYTKLFLFKLLWGFFMFSVLPYFLKKHFMDISL